MWGAIAAVVFLAGTWTFGLAPVSASAPVSGSNCRLLGPAKLIAQAGGGDAICGEIDRAIRAKAAGVRYSATIEVLSRSRVAATLLVNGRTLPVQNFAVMDGNLSESSIKHFAAALANAVADASMKRSLDPI